LTNVRHCPIARDVCTAANNIMSSFFIFGENRIP
jgi:hypothetical protein